MRNRGIFFNSSVVRALILDVGHFVRLGIKDMNQVLILSRQDLPTCYSVKKPASSVSFCIKQLNINWVIDRRGEVYSAVQCPAHLTGKRHRQVQIPAPSIYLIVDIGSTVFVQDTRLSHSSLSSRPTAKTLN